jgi:predicted AAA+ superfamily ATPase
MWRSALGTLEAWKSDSRRKPLLLRGARQVGKSWLAKQLGKQFELFVELNLEERPELAQLFDGSLDPETLLPKLQAILGKPIVPGRTLLFLDEIQAAPRAILFLRYLFEKQPNLHVAAAGSLIELALEDIGFPVGRVWSLNLYPMSFHEFAMAMNEASLFDFVMGHDARAPLDEPLHDRMLALLSEYFVSGGMPEAVDAWQKERSFEAVEQIHRDIIDTYRQDFRKYAKRKQVDHVDKIFASIPRQLGAKFMYSRASGTVKARALSSALDLLVQAGVAHKVYHSSSNGVPLRAEHNPKMFKVLPLDVGLVQTMLGLKREAWLLNVKNAIVNRGAIAEALVGLELIAGDLPTARAVLSYWVRQKPSATAEVDFVISHEDRVIPVEVKSGTAGTLKSLQLFLRQKQNAAFGLHFSMRNFSRRGAILSYPLYAVAKALADLRS